MPAHLEHNRIPSLDGLRALAIGLVLADHVSMSYASTAGSRLSFCIKTLIDGAFGTQIFILLSGFLITRLLLIEKEKSSTIGIGSFYLRRAFRILPAMWAFLGVAGVLAYMGKVDARASEFAYAGTLTWIYNFSQWNWPLSHLWSLSVDNQFYLVWPFALLMLRRAWLVRVGVGVICLCPLARYGFLISVAGKLHLACYIVQASRCDVLMYGALAAVCWDSLRFQNLLRWLCERQAHWMALAVSLGAGAWLANSAAPLHVIRAALPTYKTAAMLLFMLQAVVFSRGWVGRIFNHGWVTHWSGISYSLYLWQQLFLTPAPHCQLATTIADLMMLMVVAHASYFLIERPFGAMGRKRKAKLYAVPSVAAYSLASAESSLTTCA